jgi:glycolate oxidase FAD binding subunit
LQSVSSLAEASAFLTAAGAQGRRVRIGEDLATDGLDRVLEHEAGDLTATVEAGIRLSVLNARLAEAGQRLSLDPPGDPTIGSCIAADLSGPRRHRYGTMRDLVLGVTVVLADGTIANAGRKVVKNVAGYDLGKLLCGSRGTLALIVRVSLRLHPIPASVRTLVVSSGDPAGAWAGLRRAQLQPSAVDVLHPGRLAVLFEGSEAAVAAQLEAARALTSGEEAGEEVWAESRQRQAAARGLVVFEPGRLGETLAGLDEAVARAATGVAYVPGEAAPPVHEAVRALNERVRAAFDPEGILAP